MANQTAEAAVEITEVEGTELYERYAGQTSAQPVCVYLDCASGSLEARVNPEVGNAVPVREWRGHVQAWNIPALKAASANALLQEIAPLAQRMVDGYVSHWDGHNHVARFDADATEASEAIRALCERDWSEEEQVRVWEAEDYIGGIGDRARQASQLNITVDTTDDGLEAIVAETEAQAASDGIDIVRGLAGYLQGLRDQLRGDAEERPYVLSADEGGSEVIKAADNKAALKSLRDWLREGDYGEVTTTIWVDGRVTSDWDGWEETTTVAIDPEAPPCEDGEEHDWQDPYTVVGGSKSNPGVFGHGAGTISVDCCSRCGCKRTTDSYAQRPDTGEQGLTSVSYEAHHYVGNEAWEKFHAEEHPVPSKDEVTRWENVASYTEQFSGGDGSCTVNVQAGEHVGAWFLRTSDDAGGSDDCDDTAYDSRAAAVEAAEAFAAENDEPDEEVVLPTPDPAGQWCCYWSTALDDAGARERYATEDEAIAAVAAANEALHAANPGSLLCGFEVRQLVDGKWIAVNDE